MISEIINWIISSESFRTNEAVERHLTCIAPLSHLCVKLNAEGYWKICDTSNVIVDGRRRVTEERLEAERHLRLLLSAGPRRVPNLLLQPKEPCVFFHFRKEALVYSFMSLPLLETEYRTTESLSQTCPWSSLARRIQWIPLGSMTWLFEWGNFGL